MHVKCLARSWERLWRGGGVDDHDCGGAAVAVAAADAAAAAVAAAASVGAGRQLCAAFS